QRLQMDPAAGALDARRPNAAFVVDGEGVVIPVGLELRRGPFDGAIVENARATDSGARRPDVDALPCGPVVRLDQDFLSGGEPDRSLRGVNASAIDDVVADEEDIAPDGIDASEVGDASRAVAFEDQVASGE